MFHSCKIHSDLGDTLRVKKLIAHDELGRMFNYQVELLSLDAGIDLERLLGTPMTIEFNPTKTRCRYFNGIVVEAGQRSFQAISDLDYAQYDFRIMPKMWLLTQKRDCRIYKQMSVPDIVREVLREIGYTDIKDTLAGSYPVRDYCVQYRESYFNFLSRLMEQEGIYYYFEHHKDTHVMVLSDEVSSHPVAKDCDQLPYEKLSSGTGYTDAVISTFETHQGVHTSGYQLTDYDPIRSRVSLSAKRRVSSEGDEGGGSGLDSFDYPGGYTNVQDGERYALVRLQAMRSSRLRFQGVGNAYGLEAGTLFTLKRCPRGDLNREYLVVSAQTEITDADFMSGDEDDSTPFQVKFLAIDGKIAFRTVATAIQPNISGLQTATVAGEQAGDIEVDEYGRVQVVFHWDTSERSKHNISCPVRVASQWAGQKWGALNIPRVGQEVVVSFLEGNPDRPVIIGSVYNDANMPPYTLPENKTQSGIRSRSYEKGEPGDCNEIRFDDRKNQEELLIHAQKNMKQEVENDHVVLIDNDKSEKVKNNRNVKIGKNDFVEVDGGSTTKVVKQYQVKSDEEIQLISGQASITLKSSGEIEIQGLSIKINAANTLELEGQAVLKAKAGTEMELASGINLKVHSDTMMELNGAASTTVKGATLMLNGSGMAELQGGIIMIG